MSDKKKHQRRQRLIYPRYQLAIVGVNLLTLAVSGCFVIYEIFACFHEMGDRILRAGFPPDHPYFVALNENIHSVLWHVGSALLLGAIVSLVLGLRLSHKVVGPVHRLKVHLTALSQGKKMGALQFRKGDYFPELAELVNQVVGKDQTPKS